MSEGIITEEKEHLICCGCGEILCTTGIEPFTACECSGCGTELSVPMEMGQLRLERFVGVKGIFKIYEGFDRAKNVNSVIYILEKKHPEFIRLFNIAKTDAIHLSTLLHPNICPILNYGEADGNFFVSEPKMDGYSLSEYHVANSSLLDLNKIIDMLQSVALGLSVAHHKEFIHHDVCPKNIHIDARGNVRLKNFFVSRFTYSFSEERKDNPIFVSPYYISPEKVESRLEDKRGDVFSFGVLSYYLLTGRYPFSGISEAEIVHSRIKRKKTAENLKIFSIEKASVATAENVAYTDPAPPSYYHTEMPEEISSLVMNMLSYYPVRRPIFTEVLTAISLYKTTEEKDKVVSVAQKNMVRNNKEFRTPTKAIPSLKNLSGEYGKRKKMFFNVFSKTEK